MTKPLSPEQAFIKKLTDIVLANLQNENFGVNDLARESGLSLYAISRKLQSVKKIRVAQFVREIRLRRAMELLKEGTFTAAEVAYKVGFGSPAYFNKCFREYFGCTPGDIKSLDKDPNPDNINSSSSGNYSQAGNSNLRFLFSLRGVLLLITILGIAGIIIYSKKMKTDWYDDLVSRDGRISIAVMPFINMTGDTTLNVWQEGIQQNIISSLANNNEIEIRQKELINSLLEFSGHSEFASISTGIAGRISQKLLAALFVYGTIEKAGDKIRVNAQLIDTKTREVLKTCNLDKTLIEGSFFQALDTISQKMTNFLLISKLIKNNPELKKFPRSTNSPDALSFYIYGSKARSVGDFKNAIAWFSKSLAADSNFIDASFGLENAYAYSGNFDASKQLLIKNYNRRNRMSTRNQIYASWAYSLTFEAPEENIRYLKQLQQMDDQWPKASYELGLIYNWVGQYYNAIPEFEKAFTIYKRLGKEYMKNNSAWEGLGLAYHKTGQFKKERSLYRKAVKYIPDDTHVIIRQALLSYSENDTINGNRFVEKFSTILRNAGYTEAYLSKRLGDIYSEAGMLPMAEKYYRQSLNADPSDIDKVKALAGFFITYNRNLDEALNLIDKASESTSGYSYYEYLDMKGQCLLKLGRNREALEVLEYAYNTAPYKVYYIYSDLLKARKANSDVNPIVEAVSQPQGAH
jgi:AraC-like DNA-binding protein/tetratricopeptide (TPR) repeat protein